MIGATLTAPVLTNGAIGVNPPENTAEKPVEPVSLEELISQVPTSQPAYNPTQEVEELVKQLDSYMQTITSRIEREKTIKNNIQDYTNRLGAIETSLSNESIGEALQNCQALLTEIKNQNNPRYSNIEARAAKALASAQKAEATVQSEIKQVIAYIERFDEVKRLVMGKSYYRAKQAMTSLRNDLNNLSVHDAELQRRAKQSSGAVFKRYAGLSQLKSEISTFNRDYVQPNVANIERVVTEFQELGANYSSAKKDQDPDKLLEYRAKLKKIKVVASQKPYSDHTDFGKNVGDEDTGVKQQLTTIAQRLFNDYKTKISAIGKRIESEELSEREMNELQTELQGYIAKVKEYQKIGLFTDEYLKPAASN